MSSVHKFDAIPVVISEYLSQFIPGNQIIPYPEQGEQQPQQVPTVNEEQIPVDSSTEAGINVPLQVVHSLTQTPIVSVSSTQVVDRADQEIEQPHQSLSQVLEPNTVTSTTTTQPIQKLPVRRSRESELESEPLSLIHI